MPEHVGLPGEDDDFHRAGARLLGEKTGGGNKQDGEGS
jgi:hypothetical protein